MANYTIADKKKEILCFRDFGLEKIFEIGYNN